MNHLNGVRISLPGEECDEAYELAKRIASDYTDRKSFIIKYKDKIVYNQNRIKQYISEDKLAKLKLVENFEIYDITEYYEYFKGSHTLSLIL